MEKEYPLRCPVCEGKLRKIEKSYVCGKNHSFDIARQGYVNLLPVQNKHSRSPGDTRAMLLARREFLDNGFYEPVCRDAAELINKYKKTKTPLIADIGSGEGYYTCQLQELCSADCIGVDIAKEAAKMSCSRSRDILWTVATASHLPLEDESVDVITAVFSLFVNDEYERVLKKGGIVVEISAGNRHLTELKSIIYDEVFVQDKHQPAFSESFSELCSFEREFRIKTDKVRLRALLEMTPHSHRISKEQSERLDSISRLELTVNYLIRVLEKK